MKKVMASIIVIGLLLSTAPLGMSREEAINEEQIEEKSLPQFVSDDFEFLEEGDESSNDSPGFFKEPEYIPREMIVKFKDSVNVNIMSTPSNEVISTSTTSVVVPYTVVTNEGTMTMLPGETVTIGDEQLTIPGVTINTDITQSIPSGGLLTIGIPSIDALNEEYGVISAEVLFEDEIDSSFSNIYKFKFSSNVDIFAAALEYNDDPNVEFAEPNYIGHTCSIPNDPYFDMQWALHNTGQDGGTPDADIDAPEAWDTTTGDDDVVIAVIDSGVDYTHPDLGHCTDGIIEQEYILESWHPLNETLFEQTFSFPGYDSVSLHFSRINPGEGWIEVGFSNGGGYVFGGNFNLYDYWLMFTEYGINEITIRAIAAGDNPGWGFKIDKIKLSTFIPLSEQSDKYVDGYDFILDDPDPMDDFGHGTHCAGIAAAITNNEVDIAGVAGNCKIMPLRIISPWILAFGPGVDDFTESVLYAVKNGADVISVSIGYSSPSKLMELVLTYADLMGVVLVAAAGNEGYSIEEFCFPASHDKVIAVSATDRNDTKASFTNYGPWVDVAAPGCDILSLRAHATDMYHTFPHWEYSVPPFDPDATLYRAWGTSMSCPHVAGVAALLLSKDPDLTPREIRTIIRSSTDPVISDRYIGTGRINASVAVQKAAHVVAELDDSLDYKNLKGIVSIKGVAKGLTFDSYKVYYGEGIYPDSWQLIGSGTTRKYGGKLVSWNTTAVNDKPYSIKLTVITEDGIIYEDRSLVVIDNYANAYYVDDDYDENTPGWQIDHFDKIQDAVDICGNKDETHVANGTYYEKLTFEKGKLATLIGEDRDTTIIDASDQRYKSMVLSGGSVHISGFTLRSCIIEGVLTSNNVISGNKFIDPDGHLSPTSIIMLALYTSNNKISDNIITTVGSGIALGFSVKNSEISGNTLTDGGISIISSGKRNTISGNNVKWIDLYSTCYNNDIIDNIISNGEVCGLFLSHGRYNKISNNIIENIAGTEKNGNYYPSYGILMEPSEGFDLLADFFSGRPIFNEDSFLNEISNNTISNCDYGIYFGTLIIDAFNLQVNATCKLNVVSHNDISNTGVGILLEGACKNLIFANTLSNNDKGISIKQYNAEIGDDLVDADDNWIYHNNFIDNTQQAYDECDNLWYRPLKLEGNYWSDYTGEDNQWPFGIGDTPYNIPGGNNQDLYPLMDEYSGSQSSPSSNPQSLNQAANNLRLLLQPTAAQ